MRKQKGFLMIAAYLMLSTLFVYAFAIFSRSSGFLINIERHKNKTIAFHLAEAGVDLALTQLAASPLYTGTNGFASFNSDASKGGYSVSVSIPAGAVDVRKIQATGYAPDNDPASRAYETRTLTTYVKLGSQNYFEFAAFAKDSMKINGNPVIDSYDSTLGPYNALTAGGNGDIGTDSATASSVDLIGNAVIKGDAFVGPNGNPSSVIDVTGNAVISGTQSASTSLKNYQPATTTSASSGSLDLSGNTTQTLLAGTYHYTSLKISGNAQLVPAGAVSIYVDGEVDISGNGVATSANLPTNFLLFASGTDVKISGNSNFYGGVYAPNSNVKVDGNGSVYGSIVSKTFDQSGNGSLHFDEALKNSSASGSSNVSILAWQESNTSAWGTGT